MKNQMTREERLKLLDRLSGVPQMLASGLRRLYAERHAVEAEITVENPDERPR